MKASKDRLRSRKALEAWVGSLPPKPRVLVVGPSCRTWRQDINDLDHALGMLVTPTLLIGERRPFDTWVTWYAEHFGLDVITDTDYLYGARGAVPGRSPDLYEVSDTVIAFPVEAPPPVHNLRIQSPSPSTQPIYAAHTADPGLIDGYKKPMLVVRRYFDWEVLNASARDR